MRYSLFVFVTLMLTFNFLFARKIIVDPYGNINSIQTAINLASDGDTIKVLPGTYDEQVVLNKNVVLIGSGYENTAITGSYDPAVEIKSGIVQWFLISSLAGNGVKMSGGIIRNCVIKGSAKNGIYSEAGTGNVKNCVIVNNGRHGVEAQKPGYIYVVNCIARNNSYEDYYGNCCPNAVNVSFSIGTTFYTENNQGVVDKDPQFNSDDDYHISSGSPGWDTENPALKDPDGSRSDMGYFGGPYCPIYPVVTSIKLIPQDNGGVKIEATGRANY